MQKGKRTCKVCGEEYPYCKTNLSVPFRWQDVACCPEHAAIYFDLIAKSRGEIEAEAEVEAEEKVEKPKKQKSASKQVEAKG